MWVIGSFSSVRLEVSASYAREWLCLEAINVALVVTGFICALLKNAPYQDVIGQLSLLVVLLMTSGGPFYPHFLDQDVLQMRRYFHRRIYGLQCLAAAQIFLLVLSVVKSDDVKSEERIWLISFFALPFYAFAITSLWGLYARYYNGWVHMDKFEQGIPQDEYIHTYPPTRVQHRGAVTGYTIFEDQPNHQAREGYNSDPVETTVCIPTEDSRSQLDDYRTATRDANEDWSVDPGTGNR